MSGRIDSGHEVVEHQPLALALARQPLRPLEVAGVDRLDDPLHRRPRHLAQLLVLEPPLAHATRSA